MIPNAICHQDNVCNTVYDNKCETVYDTIQVSIIIDTALACILRSISQNTLQEEKCESKYDTKCETQYATEYEEVGKF